MMPKKISVYIISEFIKMFLLVLFTVFTVVFIVDFLEFSPKIQAFSISPRNTMEIILFRIPSMLEPVIQFIVLLSTVFSMTKLLSKNELVVFYSIGISDWKILGLLGTSAFILGIFFATIYSKISVNLLKRSDILERQCKGIVDNRYFIKPKNGIWLKQSSPAAGNSKEQPGRNYTIVIRAAEVFLDDLIFNDVILIIFNSGGFSRRIDARYMQMDDGVLVLHGARIVEQGKNILSQDKITIPTSGWKDFTRRQIQNRYENLQFIDSLSLKKLIGEIKSYGLDAHKFEVKRNNFILLPFMYALMASIGVLLSSRNPRNAKYAIRILFALIIGMLVFTLQNTIVELSLGNKINYLNSTWGLFALATLIAYMKLVDKIELQNFKTTGGSGWS